LADGEAEVALAFINIRSGIDVYAHWRGKTLPEERAQIRVLDVLGKRLAR
jgi:hypothetical protein